MLILSTHFAQCTLYTWTKMALFKFSFQLKKKHLILKLDSCCPELRVGNYKFKLLNATRSKRCNHVLGRFTKFGRDWHKTECRMQSTTLWYWTEKGLRFSSPQNIQGSGKNVDLNDLYFIMSKYWANMNNVAFSVSNIA